MYRLGRQLKHRIWPYTAAAVIVAGLMGGAVLWLHGVMQPHTTLTQASPVTHHVTVMPPKTETITRSPFTFSLPAGWQAMREQSSPYRVYGWRGAGPDASRRLEVYVDTLPSKLAVNRLLPVQTDGNRLTISGTVSDNCSDFTDRTQESAATGTAPAKWGGVNFICDLGNYERDVVAIGSDAGINTVLLTGSKTGPHRVLLVYTDNDASPDYEIFMSIIGSFRLL